MEKKKVEVGRHLKRFIDFVKSNFVKIVFLLLLFRFLEWIHTLPYVNIIRDYQLFEIVIFVSLLWVFFHWFVTNKGLLIAAILSFILAIPATLVKIDVMSETLGFIAFILLCIVLIQRIFIERKELRDIPLDE